MTGKPIRQMPAARDSRAVRAVPRAASTARGATWPGASGPVPGRFLNTMGGAMKRIIRAMRWLDDHWIGDLIGALCLFGMLWMALVAGAVLQ